MSEDLVSATFTTLRVTAKKRGEQLPDLGHQGRNVVPRRAVGKLDGGDETSISVPGLDLTPETTKRSPRVGQPTGKDGRAVPRTYEVAGFNSLIKREINERAWTESIAHGWVTGSWEALVGEKIAQHTQVDMIKDGALFISCDQTAWASHLRAMKPVILATIAEKIGVDLITEMHIYPPKTKSWRYGPLHVKGRGPRDTYG